MNSAITCCIVISLLVSISVTVSIFARYIWTEHFPISAFLNIGTCFTLAFFQIGLAATDLAFIGKDEAMQSLLKSLWFCVYWGSILSGSVAMTFYKLYWASGRFSIKSKVKFVMKTLFI